MTKKILLIIGILIALGVAVLFISEETPTTEGGSRVGFSIRNYLPFGSNNDSDSSIRTDEELARDNGQENVSDTIATNQPAQQLRKISSGSVAGAAIFNIGTTTFVRWVEKGTGNVYEARSDTSLIIRLTNTTIPKIVRAIWLSNGNGFLAQTVIPESEIIETSFVELKKAPNTTTESLTPYDTSISKLPTGIKELVVSADSKKIFYYTAAGSASFYTANPNGTNAILVASHPLGEWVPRYWVGNTKIFLQTKESANFPAHYYILDLETKNLPRTANPVGIVMSTVFVLIDKCSLPTDEQEFVYCAIPNELPNATYPDDWYKGIVSTEDSIRKIDARSGIYYNTVNLSTLSGQKIDVDNLSVGKDETHLIFRNKIDGFLWMLRIEE